ncbi:MAG: DUF2442 domain-containing protein [Anaerolineae bacterium]|nr:DUF2442 domain-containing protein [Anaerolineae bacterium]
MPADFEYTYETDRPVEVVFDGGSVTVTLADGRRISNPLAWFPWLERANAAQRANVDLDAFSVYWPDLDEGLDVEGMLRGIGPRSSRAAEGAASG